MEEESPQAWEMELKFPMFAQVVAVVPVPSSSALV